MCGICKELQIFLTASRTDGLNVCGQLLNSINRRFSYLPDISSTPVTPMARAISRYFTGALLVVFHNDRSIMAHATPCGVSNSTKGVPWRSDSKTYVGEATCDVLATFHSFASPLLCLRQHRRFGDDGFQFDGFQWNISAVNSFLCSFV